MKNIKLEKFRTEIQDKRIAVLGAGISNRPLIRWLYPMNKNIHVFDQLPADDEVMQKTISDIKAEGIDVNWSLGKNYLDNLKNFDLIFRTPHFRPDRQELVAEKERGAQVTSEMEVFLKLCPAEVRAITGSSGKTTTSSLIAAILEAANYRVFCGGNIGTPLLDQIENIREEDKVVVELSSFQLMDMRPAIDLAIITNVVPNHLDFHKDFAEYCQAKKNIFLGQNEDDILIVNADDKVSSAWSEETAGQVRYFNSQDSDKNRAWVQDDKVYLQMCRDSEPILLVSAHEVELPGRFNLDNIQAAALACIDIADIESIRKVVSEFKGVAHRLEWIRNLDGADWYNSSIDTSPERTINSLEAMQAKGRDMVLIAGGKDKNCNYENLGKAILASTRRIILLGENAKLIENSIKKAADNNLDYVIRHVDSYKEAVKEARKMAKSGDIVVLSPAGTSLDWFRHFEERGNLFCKLVMAQEE